MKIKENLQRQEEQMMEMELGYQEWLDRQPEPTVKELEEMEREYINSRFFNERKRTKPLNNQDFNPKRGA